MALVRTKDEHAGALARYMPGGRLFHQAWRDDSNFRKLLLGLAAEFLKAEEYIRVYASEIQPATTTLFIEEWERAVGIPDDCFAVATTLADRRRNVLLKLAALGVQTSDDFVGLAAIFGITATVESGAVYGTFPMKFPIILFDTERDARFTIVVSFTVDDAETFPYTFPFVFGAESVTTMRCLFENLKPANCDLIFRQVA